MHAWPRTVAAKSTAYRPRNRRLRCWVSCSVLDVATVAFGLVSARLAPRSTRIRPPRRRRCHSDIAASLDVLVLLLARRRARCFRRYGWHAASSATRTRAVSAELQLGRLAVRGAAVFIEDSTRRSETSATAATSEADVRAPTRECETGFGSSLTRLRARPSLRAASRVRRVLASGEACTPSLGHDAHPAAAPPAPRATPADDDDACEGRAEDTECDWWQRRDGTRRRQQRQQHRDLRAPPSASEAPHVGRLRTRRLGVRCSRRHVARCRPLRRLLHDV